MARVECDAGATWREIADGVGLDWRTVKKYLSPDTLAGPPVAPSRRGSVTRKVDAVVPVIDAWLAADPRLKASVIHERLVAEHGFDGHYQRVKLYVAEARQRLAKAGDSESGLHGLHRRFEVVAGAQARVLACPDQEPHRAATVADAPVVGPRPALVIARVPG